MYLRKEFEKDHPIPAKLTNLPNERHFSPEYVEWLEQRLEAGQHETIVIGLNNHIDERIKFWKKMGGNGRHQIRELHVLQKELKKYQ